MEGILFQDEEYQDIHISISIYVYLSIYLSISISLSIYNQLKLYGTSVIKTLYGMRTGPETDKKVTKENLYLLGNTVRHYFEVYRIP